MKRVFFLLLFCIGSILLTQKANYCQIIPNNNWRLQTLGITVNAIKFVDENTGWCCGDYSTIIETTNAGLTWEIKYDTAKQAIRFINISFVNHNTGFVSGLNHYTNKGIILKTTNSGNNWNMTEFPGPINQTYFLNINEGFAASINGIIYKTTNAGSNWIQLNSGTSHIFNSLYFFNVDIGIAACNNTINEGIILKTTNGGYNWEQVHYDNTYSPGRVVIFIDDLTGYAGTGNKILKTTNQGQNWTNSFTFNNTWVSNIQFLNANTGFASSGRYGISAGEVVKTTNGGQTWNYCLTTRSGYVNFINENIGYSLYSDIGKQGLRKSFDGGNHWTTIFAGSEYANASLDFNTNYKGWLLSSRTINTTTDGGLTWDIPLALDNDTYNCVGFLNNNTGWILGGTESFEMSPFFKTNNGGVNWNKIFVDYKMFNSIYKNDSIMYATGLTADYTGFIMKSNQSGTLDIVYSLANNTFYGINFINKYTGYVVGKNGIILKTTDIGQTWNIQTSPSSQENYSVYFIDSLKGWIVGNREYGLYGDLLKTTNGGTNWTIQMQFNTFLKDIKFIDKNIGWIVGGNGTILFTTNSGNNWNYYPKFIGFDFESIYFKDNKTGWLLGNNGLLLRTDNCGGLVSVLNISTELPSKCSLSQNYPNPFNPTTKMRFGVVHSGDVKIVVYDIMGREVQTLVNESLKPGTYETSFDGSHLSSGVYLYQMTAGDLSETKKMLLIK